MTLKTPPDDEGNTQVVQALTSSTHETLRVASHTQAYDDGVRGRQGLVEARPLVTSVGNRDGVRIPAG